jgi:hypothetical protein
MTEREVSSGAGLLRAFLAEKGVTQTAAGEALGVSGVTVHDWVSGSKRPKAHHREAVALWTHGVVPVDSWRLSKEHAAVAVVKPFEAPIPAEDPGALPPDSHAATGTDDG